MVNRIDTNAAPEIDKLNAQDAAAILTHALSSSGRSLSNDNFVGDDLIVSLAEAYENRRARQVNEWEKRQHVSRSL